MCQYSQFACCFMCLVQLMHLLNHHFQIENDTTLYFDKVIATISASMSLIHLSVFPCPGDIQLSTQLPSLSRSVVVNLTRVTAVYVLSLLQGLSRFLSAQGQADAVALKFMCIST